MSDHDYSLYCRTHGIVILIHPQSIISSMQRKPQKRKKGQQKRTKQPFVNPSSQSRFTIHPNPQKKEHTKREVILLVRQRKQRSNATCAFFLSFLSCAPPPIVFVVTLQGAIPDCEEDVTRKKHKEVEKEKEKDRGTTLDSTPLFLFLFACWVKKLIN